MSSVIENEIHCLKYKASKISSKLQVLRDLDFFILDNSIRESTVGQLRGHTLDNKWKIYDEVKRCGIKHIVVAAFSHMTRVDDHFIKELVERKEDMSTLYSFVEVTSGVSDGMPNRDAIPVAMTKMKELGLRNPIIEIDLADSSVDWKRFSTEDMCDLLRQRIDWAHENLCDNSKVFVNLRDFPFAMIDVPERVLTVVRSLGCSSKERRPEGILFEEPTGRFLPEELAVWCTSVRRVMDSCEWKSGKLLVHVHEKWGLAETAQLQCLSAGANGVWASLCEEGAAMGHACSTVTLMNLVRMGNEKVLKEYNCTYLREAARKVTLFTTGTEPHSKKIVYGERSCDLTFDFSGIAGGRLREEDFDMPKFFGIKPPIRITTLASEKMILERLQELFGEDPQFTIQMANQMKETMIEDLRNNRKEEYMSEVGIAILFDRSGGKMTKRMCEVIANVQHEDMERLIGDVRTIWDRWDLEDEVQGDNCLQYDSFYNGFMAPYFGCFRCEDTRKGLQAIDMDKDGLVEWKEFLVYLKWALHEYPEIKDADQLISTAFRKGLIPAMRDEVLKDQN